MRTITGYMYRVLYTNGQGTLLEIPEQSLDPTAEVLKFCEQQAKEGREADKLFRIFPDGEEHVMLLTKEAKEGPFTSYEDAFEAMGWKVDADSDGVEISQFSPAGEDFRFSIDGNDIPGEVADFADNFDEDEHVKMWVESMGRNGVPDSFGVLLEDAEAIHKMLDDLAEALNNVQTNCELGTYDCSTCAISGKCDREEEDSE